MSSRAEQGQSRPADTACRDHGSAPLADSQPDVTNMDVYANVTPAPYFERAMLWQWPLALVMLIGFAPVMVLIAILIRITSPGPAIYRQTRLGRNGKPFTLYKFRSMHLDAEAKTGAVWAKPGDPRVTLLGKITRNLHLDELPQLFNVMRGEMALVGPRPERPEFTSKIEQHVPEFSQRLCIRPGITGLAQVHQGPDVDLASVRRKLVYDLEYARCAGAWLDWRIMVCTLLRATEFTRTSGIRILRIPTPSVEHLLPAEPIAQTVPAKSAPAESASLESSSAQTAAAQSTDAENSLHSDLETDQNGVQENGAQATNVNGESNGHASEPNGSASKHKDRAISAENGAAAQNGADRASHSVAPAQ